MGKSGRSSRRRKSLESSSSASSQSPSPSSSSSTSYESESSERRRRRKRKQRSSRHRERSSSSSKKRHHSSKKSSSSRKRDSARDDERRRKRRKHRSSSSSDDESGSEPERHRGEPEAFARDILEKFPDIAADLEQLLQMIDNGQGVDVRGISDKSLVKHLKKLFVSLKLKQNESGVFLLPPLGHCTLDVIGPILCSHLKSRDDHLPKSGSPIREQSSQPDLERVKSEVDNDTARMTESLGKQDSPIPRRR